jgi:hypothetical protein
VKHITKPEVDNVIAYLSYLRDFLGISSTYRILICNQTAEENCDDEEVQAHIEAERQRWTCHLYLSKEWMDWCDEHKTYILLHELLHIMQRDLDVLIEDFWQSPRVSSDDYVAYDKRYHRLVEQFVDRIASVLLGHVTTYPGPLAGTPSGTWYASGARRRIAVQNGDNDF